MAHNKANMGTVDYTENVDIDMGRGNDQMGIKSAHNEDISEGRNMDNSQPWMRFPLLPSKYQCQFDNISTLS